MIFMIFYGLENKYVLIWCIIVCILFILFLMLINFFVIESVCFILWSGDIILLEVDCCLFDKSVKWIVFNILIVNWVIWGWYILFEDVEFVVNGYLGIG